MLERMIWRCCVQRTHRSTCFKQKKGVGGVKINVGAAESFSSARKAICHVSHLMGVKKKKIVSHSALRP